MNLKNQKPEIRVEVCLKSSKPENIEKSEYKFYVFGHDVNEISSLYQTDLLNFQVEEKNR